MDCKISCFDRVMHLVKGLPKGKVKEAVQITTEYSFQDFLEFCVENGCFSKEQSDVLYYGIVM